MATEPNTTSSCYDPTLTYTPPVGRLPVLGKVRAQIDLLRAQVANERNQVLNRDLGQIDSNAKITAEIAALQTQTADNTRKITAEITNDNARLVNETNRLAEEITASRAKTANETAQTVNDTTRATNDTNRAIGELASLASKTDAEVSLLNQKRETELAQVSDVVATGTVVGVIGKQKNLFQKQADGFDRDAEQKLAKIYTETWAVRQSTDGDPDPNSSGLGNAAIAAVLTKARAGINI